MTKKRKEQLTQEFSEKLNQQLDWYIIDLDKKEITKNNKQTHIFWVEIYENALKISSLFDSELVDDFRDMRIWTSKHNNRSHKWIGTKIVKICVDFCIDRNLDLIIHITDLTYWQKLSKLFNKNFNSSFRVHWKELKKLKRDIFWFTLKQNIKRFFIKK